jgi:hypothetical protein
VASLGHPWPGLAGLIVGRIKMSSDFHAMLAAALTTRGWKAFLQNADQLVVSSQDSPVWPERGNSFWVSHREGTWYLSTWAPVGYRVPTDRDIILLCLECLTVGSCAMSRVPEEIATRFSLTELEPEEYDRVFRRTDLQK